MFPPAGAKHMAKSKSPPEGVRILRPSLDDEEGGETILRGLIDLQSLPLLRVDYYQREQLSQKANRNIQRAIDTGSPLPDITLGMRGDRFHVDETGAVVLLDPVFIIDGQQRVSTIKLHLQNFPEEKIRLGAAVHFNSNATRESRRFHAMNLYATRVGSGVILRNLKDEIPLLASLYGLSITERSFPLYRRICWAQSRHKDHLITAATYIHAALRLHAHLAAVRHSGARHLPQICANLSRAAPIQQVRENVATLWSVIDQAWGVADLQALTGVPYLKTGFLEALVTVLSSHLDFWDGPRLKISPEHRQRLRVFKVHNPEIVRLASSGHGPGQDMLRHLLAEHLNQRLRRKLTPRIPIPQTDDEDVAA